MISQPAFFARDDWVADHADWHPRIRGGKTIDVARGDGQRILAERLERTVRLRHGAAPLADELRRYGAPQTVQPRLGQGTFRMSVTNAYGACAVSGEHNNLEASRLHPPPFFNCCFHPSTRALFPSASASGTIPFF